MRIFYRGELGMCVENAIDNLCDAISVFVIMVTFGSGLIWSKNEGKNAISPFVVMGLIVAISVYLAFIDPAKWLFVIAQLPPIALVIIAHEMDIREDRKGRMDG